MEMTNEAIIIPAETSAHIWMDRFIEKYEDDTNEAVSSKNGKIIWNDGLDEHSIYLDKDRFIIDGKEIFITTELWNKYLRMREITGAIYVRAPKKIAFPDDWSELSDEQVLENIQYLQKNYKKYKISKPDDKSITIDNIAICRDNEGTIGNGRTFYTVNNRKYYRDEGNGKELIELVHLCKMHSLPLKTKAKNWWNDNKDVIELSALITGLFIVVGGLALYIDKNEKKSKEQFKQEVIKEALDSLRKEQQKMINYNDSVKVR